MVNTASYKIYDSIFLDFSNHGNLVDVPSADLDKEILSVNFGGLERQIYDLDMKFV